MTTRPMTGSETTERSGKFRWVDARGSIPEWVMLLVMGVGIVMALWAVVQPDITAIVSDAFARLRG